MSEETHNQAWQKLFTELNVSANLENSGRFDLKAETIKKVSGKEPRIMCKWDSRESRPKVLRDASVTILPTSRQGYALIKGDGYERLPESEPAIQHPSTKIEKFTTLPWRNELTKESLAIDVAAVSSMLRKFTGEEDLALTIRGRSGTPKFSFAFSGIGKTHDINVDRAQIEIDAGFEGEKVWLIEAKIGEPNDFLVRQLFYPWRVWQELTKKPVVPLFLCYTNKTFGLFRYGFNDAQNYHSIKLLDRRWFTFDEPEGMPSLGDLFESTQSFTPEKSIPFPQADTLGTVISAIELSATPENSAQEIAETLNFDERQGSYYTAAAEWLGFIQRDRSRRELTQRGVEFVSATRPQRFKLLFKAVAATPVFRDFIRRNLEGNPGTEPEIAEMIFAKGYVKKSSTANRRAKTVVAWIHWLWREHTNLSREAN